MSYNLVMPEEKQTSLRPRWVPLWLWQWRWVALAVLFILAWWLVPPLLYRHTGADAAARLKAITDTRTALFAGLIGVGALLTFWLNSRVYRITARTLQVTEQGHITERYTKAIEQLGDDGLTIRLGGIYALERITVDSERDHPTFVEVLSAFVRESAAAPPPDDGPEQKPKPATDVQAALTVLGRLPKRANVSRGDLSGAQLAGTDLTGAQLTGTDLAGARLGGANLAGAALGGADLAGADLNVANLAGARLDAADLTRARLHGADLTRARLDAANLTGTFGLTQAQLDATHGDAATRLLDGLQRPAGWPDGEASVAADS
jgi:Pentapeptide repeats (8 copies)